MALPLQAAFYVPPSSTLPIPIKTLETPRCYFGNGHPQRPSNLENSTISFIPFVDQLRFPEGQLLANVKVSAKSFCLSIQSSVIPPLSLRNISSSTWKLFWSLSFTTIQRNVIYRLITGCIPHSHLLNRIMPAIFDSPLCPVCLSSTDSATHLLFHCPTKDKVWQGVTLEFLSPTTSISNIKEALLSLDFSNIWYSQHKRITPYRILIIALSQLWLVHMRFIFDQIPLYPIVILATIRSNVFQTIEEDQYRSLL
ncbi:hypothetical protein INT46_001041 [Mucor plumbeus]|uniref:Reverse transcriptase zinc-binding domain-containing protein n=1 Tax=Mucor plumbeus TaxID=97098 RepID=A0A8H7US19_9FUNG|nr:hypothetical protein INT46_001041 [Mucor plumbeus]